MHKFIKVNESNLLDTFSLISQLRTDLSENEYQDSFKTMQAEGYQMIALVEDNSIKALAGFTIQTNFYNKKHLFLYDLVTDSEVRSKSYGNKMMKHLEEIASDNACKYVALESGLVRLDAHRFYEDKNDYDKFCYSFRKSIF